MSLYSDQYCCWCFIHDMAGSLDSFATRVRQDDYIIADDFQLSATGDGIHRGSSCLFVHTSRFSQMGPGSSRLDL